MAIVRIREFESVGTGPNAGLSFDGEGEYPITIRDPFSKEEEERLEWYFEEHLVFPFLRQAEATAAAASVRTYGEDLFRQVFADPDAYARYKAELQAGLENLRFEVVGTPSFHSLHWESLKDPRLPEPLVLEAPMVRKRLGPPPPVRAHARPSPTINLLLVVARPRASQDVGYRTISRPLVEGLRQAGLRVDVEIVRPGTYEALVNHLEAAKAEHGTGHYQIVHFDVHGALLTYEAVQKGAEADSLLYQARYGRSDLKEFPGMKAFLFLEGHKPGQADPVEAGEVADLLIRHQVPVVVLNACQSGKQVKEALGKEVEVSETSLGSRLMQAGAQVVVAMGYSVTVTAAELMMQTLYRELFAGQQLSGALCRARLELYNRKGRRAYFNQTIDLEDWLLPVVYQNHEARLAVRDFTPAEQAAYFERQAERYPFPQPTYGFFGRDLDILQIEKRLLKERNVLLVTGLGGAGKTTLLRHLGAWWQTTEFVDEVFEFGYDQSAWTRQQLLESMGKKLLSAAEYARFQPLKLAAQQAMLAERLRAKRHLLILDNLESITGSHLAIRNTLPREEQEALRKLLEDLVGGRTLVLLGSRGNEAWLAKGTFEDNIYELPGLDPEAASALADKILERHGATRHRQEADFERLLRLLNGYPLPLEVVLANLARQSPAQVLGALEAGDVHLDSGDARDKTESILRCIEYSHSNLSPEAQGLLACLAPFTSVLSQPLLGAYSARLKEQPALASLGFGRWPEVIREATNWGLLKPHPDAPGYFELEPTLPYFLRSRLQAPEQAELRLAIETAFREFYDGFSSSINQLEQSKVAEEKQLGLALASLEYENLITCVSLSVRDQVSILNPYAAASGYLDAVQDNQRGLGLSDTVLKGLGGYSQDKLAGRLGLEFVGVLDDQASRFLELKRYAEAKAAYQRALALHLANRSLGQADARRMSASIYHQLGGVAQEQRHWAEAEQCYQKALETNIEFKDRYEQAGTYQQLGRVAQEQRKWADAEQYYQKALEIFIEFKDRYAQAGTYRQLGRVAQEQRQWAEAELCYQEALEIDVEFGDRYEQAGAYHQLGMVAQEQRKWADVEQYYQKALEIKIEFKDRYSQASAYHALGRVAQEQRQRPEAEQYYQKALEILIEFRDRYWQASTYHNLGAVAQEQRQWGEAEQYYQEALEIFIDFNDRHSQARTYHNPGSVAQAQRRWAEAEQYYQKALEIYVEFKDRYNQARTYHQLGIVAQEQRQWAAAEQDYQKALEIYVEFKDRYEQASTYHQLGRVAQEQRQWAQARDYFLSALEAYRDYKDAHNLSIVLSSLARLWQESRDAGIPSAVAGVLGITAQEAEDLLRAAP